MWEEATTEVHSVLKGSDCAAKITWIGFIGQKMLSLQLI